MVTEKPQWVVDAPDGTRLQGVKELFEWEAEYFKGQGYTLTEYKPDTFGMQDGKCIHPGIFATERPAEYCPLCNTFVPREEL